MTSECPPHGGRFRIGGRWLAPAPVHALRARRLLRQLPNRHATAHWHEHADHPLIRSYEPGEDWWWCYADDLFFEIDGAPPSPSHP